MGGVAQKKRKKGREVAKEEKKKDSIPGRGKGAPCGGGWVVGFARKGQLACSGGKGATY